MEMVIIIFLNWIVNDNFEDATCDAITFKAFYYFNSAFVVVTVLF